jgi:DNA (cytosine-5)-methyltransferase 1
MKTITTLLSGGDLVGVGAREAGLTHLQGFEIEDDIAQVARDNGFNVITANVMELDPHTLEIPDVLHVSPVCKRASGANQSAELNEDGTKEAPEDVELGGKIAQFIDVMAPKVFTLENVYQYRNFKAFKIICAALDRNGYMWDFDNLNAADYGVPQTRRRLILRAIRGALLPNLPQPEKWVGWLESIIDLIPALPESQFAPWQLANGLPFDDGSFIIDQLNYHKDGTRNSTIRRANEPVWSIPIHSSKHPAPRAFVVGSHYGQPNTSIVEMNIKALARFQSLPDSYININPKIVGNGVPPLLYQKIIHPLIGA